MDPPAKRREEELRRLMARYQAGEMEAFESLYERLAPRLRAVLAGQSLDWGAEPDDLLQETFLQLHRSRHTWSPARPVEPWAFAIARHVYLMDRRSRQRKQAREIRHEPSREIATRSPEAHVQARDRLTHGLRSTTPGRRQSLLLHHLWGFSFKEIGKLLGVRPSAAKLRSSRGTTDVRRTLEKDEEER